MQQKGQKNIKAYVKKFGFWGFMFFFVKGLLWLIVPALIAWFSLG